MKKTPTRFRNPRSEGRWIFCGKNRNQLLTRARFGTINSTCTKNSTKSDKNPPPSRTCRPTDTHCPRKEEDRDHHSMRLFFAPCDDVFRRSAENARDPCRRGRLLVLDPLSSERGSARTKPRRSNLVVCEERVHCSPHPHRARRNAVARHLEGHDGRPRTSPVETLFHTLPLCHRRPADQRDEETQVECGGGHERRP